MNTKKERLSNSILEMFTGSFDSPIGTLYITASNIGIRSISTQYVNELEENEHIRVAKEQLQEYFDKKRQSFDVSVDFPPCTPFQRSVWVSLLNIPYGQVRSYKDIAAAIDRPAAVRAVGTAIGKNPFTIIYPCHRVILSSGKLGNYSSGGIDVKRALLNLEGSTQDKDRVCL